jgi:hypothetical protein
MPNSGARKSTACAGSIATLATAANPSSFVEGKMPIPPFIWFVLAVFGFFMSTLAAATWITRDR